MFVRDYILIASCKRNLIMEKQPIGIFLALEELKHCLPESRRQSSPLQFTDEQANYCDGHRAYRQITANSVDCYCKYLIKTICDSLEGHDTSKELYICSIGCGDGEADYKVLSEVQRAYPLAKVCYFGIDLNNTSCLQAEENLAALHAPYTINVVNEGILEVDPDSLPKFDIIIMAHVHYYFSKNLRSFFAKAMKLCQPHSGRIEVIATQYTPMWQLRAIFNYHQCYAHILMNNLDHLGVKYSVTDLPGEADFSQCVADNFSSLYSIAALGFICHTDLRQHTPQVAELCSNYIKSCLDERGCCDCSGLAITIPHAPIM